MDFILFYILCNPSSMVSIFLSLLGLETQESINTVKSLQSFKKKNKNKKLSLDDKFCSEYLVYYFSPFPQQAPRKSSLISLPLPSLPHELPIPLNLTSSPNFSPESPKTSNMPKLIAMSYFTWLLTISFFLEFCSPLGSEVSLIISRYSSKAPL